MSLPQRKKTPEEIAKLREELGIPGGPTTAPHTSSPTAPEPAAPAAPSEPSSEQQLPAEEEISPTPAEEPLEEPPSPIAEAPEPVVEYQESAPVSRPKPVRSLRRSERIPSSRPVAISTDSSLPTQRRTEKELSMLRRSQPITTAPVAHLIALTAHPFTVGLGYFLVIGAAILPFLDWKLTEISFYLPAIMCAGGLFIAGFIFLKKKRSLHHAGFLAMIALLVIVFGALYYFPQLRNAS